MAASDAHVYRPGDGHGLRHDPFNSIVGPRPIGWISTVDANGRRNLAPYSFFNAFNYTPPIVGFASVGWKDSVANAQATGEFVWNLVDESVAAAMNATSASVPHGEDEFVLGGLTAVAGHMVRAPLVLESRVNFECRTTQIVRLQTASGDEVETWLVLGEVVAVHIDRGLIEDGVYQSVAGKPVLRWGRAGDYARVLPEAVFQMTRPR